MDKKDFIGFMNALDQIISTDSTDSPLKQILDQTQNINENNIDDFTTQLTLNALDYYEKNSNSSYYLHFLPGLLLFHKLLSLP